MRKLSNVLIPIVIVIIIAFLIMPGLFGLWMKGKYEAWLAEYSTPTLQFNLVSFKRGWFTSTAKVRVDVRDDRALVRQLTEFTLPKQMGKLVSYTIDDDIHQGPVIFSKRSNGHWHMTLGQALVSSRIANQDEDIAARTLVRFDGSMLIVVDAPLITDRNDSIQFVLHNLTGRVDFEAGDRGVVGQMRCKQVVVTQGQMHMQADNIVLALNLKKYLQDLWLGSRTIAIQQYALTLNPNQNLILNNLAFNDYFAANENNRRLNAHMLFTVQDARYNGQQLGPYALRFHILNLDAPALIKLRKQILLAQSVVQPSTQQLQQVQQDAIALLSEGATFQLKQATIDTTWGLLNMTGDLQVPQHDVSPDVKQLFGSAKGSFQVELPKAMLRQLLVHHFERQAKKATQPSAETPEQLADKELNQALTKGWLIDIEQNYKIVVKLSDSNVTVNDKPLKPEHQTGIPVKPADVSVIKGQIKKSALKQGYYA